MRRRRRTGRRESPPNNSKPCRSTQTLLNHVTAVRCFINLQYVICREFLQRYSLMSNAIREVPPGEVVFNLERFGQIFDHETLQLRRCMVNPQGTAQKTLLWWVVCGYAHYGSERRCTSWSLIARKFDICSHCCPDPAFLFAQTIRAICDLKTNCNLHLIAH